MPYKTVIISILLLVLFSDIQSQNKIDSLNTILDEYLKNDQKAKAADVFIKLYHQTEQTEDFMALQYAASALQIYTELNDSSNIAFTHRLIGDNYFSRDILSMAMRSYTKSFEIYSLIHDDIQLAYSHLKIGQIFLAQKLVQKAEESFNNALELFKKHQDKEGIALVYDNLAEVILFDQEQNDKRALSLLDSALEIRKTLNKTALIALSYEHIADAYFYFEDYDIAGEYLEKALDKYKITGNKLKQADAYFRFGEKYLYDEKYQKADLNFSKALAIYENLGIQEKTAQTYNKLAQTALSDSRLKKSENYAKQALGISYRADLHRVRLHSFKILSDVYAKKRNTKLAYQYLYQYTQLNDTVRIEDQNRQSTEQQINLATQKKEQEIKILQEHQKLQSAEEERLKVQQKALFFGLILAAVILVLLAFFGYYFYKTNKKTKLANALLIEKNEEINKQKEEIRKQKEQVEAANISIIKQNEEIKLINQKIQASMTYASRIQRAMQPKMKDIRKKLPESFVMLSPKEAVSGDFFWYGETLDAQGNEKLVITAVDCTGHGVPGAFMSMLGDAYLTQIVHQNKITEPNIILEELHKGIVTSLQQDKTKNSDGMDMGLCVIDKKNKTLEFAGAKNPIVYIQDDELHIIKGDHTSIGGMLRGVTRKYTKHVIDISKPTTFYLYSDGFQDQFGGEHNKKYMAKRFREFLYSISKQDINEQAMSVAVELDDWKGERPQMDDVLIIGVKL